jgi:hypothetical protein
MNESCWWFVSYLTELQEYHKLFIDKLDQKDVSTG